MADKELIGNFEQLDCSDCVNHGGDWDCDHVQCHKGADTISRAAALDALGERPMPWTDDDDYVIGGRNQYDSDRLAIETVPSAHPDFDAYCDRLYKIAYERGKREAVQWIPCKTALPETEEKVLVTCEHLDIYGKPHRYVCKAYHVDRYTVRADFDYWDEGCDEYREEDDQYYVLEGWYEYIHNWGDYCSVRITEDKVVAWLPLPEPYKDGEYEKAD